MTQHLPEWIMIRYAKLWLKFKEKEFSKSEAEKILPKDTSIAVVLSDLKKYGWLEMKMDQKDARKTIYELKEPKKAISEEIRELARK